MNSVDDLLEIAKKICKEKGRTVIIPSAKLMVTYMPNFQHFEIGEYIEIDLNGNIKTYN